MTGWTSMDRLSNGRAGKAALRRACAVPVNTFEPAGAAQ